jgi:hypothetical protein
MVQRTPNGSSTGVERVKRVTLPITPEILRIRDLLKQETGIEMTYVQVIDHVAHEYLDRLDKQGEKDMPKPITPDYFTEEHAVAMTLRDYFAAKAMHTLYMSIYEWESTKNPRSPEFQAIVEELAVDAYVMADAMLKARGQE